MILPSHFSFTQTNLQDYVDCRYRFYLRHYLNNKWPALISEDALAFEQRGQSGARFHRIVEQFLTGLPQTHLDAMVAADPDPWVSSSWGYFLEEMPPQLDGKLYVETLHSAALFGQRVKAKYDVIQIHPNGTITIYDWKTARPPGRQSHLAARIQTRLYRFLIVHTGAELIGQSTLAPDQIEMVYWYAGHPAQSIRFPYNQKQFEHDQVYFSDLFGEIGSLSIDEFHRTEDASHCRFCIYRSHCDRGARAGDWDDFEGSEMDQLLASGDLDFDQIGEISFL